jgi:hypothetical protein
VKGHSLLIVDPPEGDAPRVMVLSWDDEGALGPTPNLPQPLEPDTRVTFLGGELNREKPWPQFRLHRHVERCSAAPPTEALP